MNFALTEAQKFQDSYDIIFLFRKAYESFSGLKAPRMASNSSNRMAGEYFIAKDFSYAKQLFNGVACHYRQEGWVALLWKSLGYLQKCSKQLGSAKYFIE